MRLVADTDALIKLTRCGAKSRLTAAFNIVIPEAVHREAIVEGLRHRYDDAAVLKRNVDAGRIRVMTEAKPTPEEAALPEGGEREVYRLFKSLAGQRRWLVTDDHRVLQRLLLLGVRGITPGALLVLAVRQGKAATKEARGWLEALRPMVSAAEYESCRMALAAYEGKGD